MINGLCIFWDKRMSYFKITCSLYYGFYHTSVRKISICRKGKNKKKQSRIVVIDLGRHQPKENSNQDSNQEMFLSNAIKHGGHSGCTVFLRTAVWSQP